MPAELHRKLEAQVRDRSWSEKRKDAYVYGVMRKTGWKPAREIAKAAKKLRGK